MLLNVIMSRRKCVPLIIYIYIIRNKKYNNNKKGF